MGGCKGDWKTEMQDNRNIGQRKAAGETAAMSAPQDQAGDTNPDMGSLAKCAKCGNESSRTVPHYNLLDGAQIQCCHSCLDKCLDKEEDSDMPELVSATGSEIMREHELVRATGGDPAKMIQLIEGLQESIRELEARVNVLELAAIKAGPVDKPQVSVAVYQEDDEEDSDMPELVSATGSEIMREHELVSTTGGDPAKMIQLIEECISDPGLTISQKHDMLTEIENKAFSEQELGPLPATAARSVEELWRPPTSSSDNPPQGTAESTTTEGTTTDEWSSVATTPVHQCSGQYCWTCYPPIQGPLATCKTVGCTRYENRHGASYCAGYCCWFCMKGKKWQDCAWHGKKCQKWNGQFRHDWRNIVGHHRHRSQGPRLSDHPVP